jgi:hypothetical protein
MDIFPLLIFFLAYRTLLEAKFKVPLNLFDLNSHSNLKIRFLLDSVYSPKLFTIVKMIVLFTKR